VANEALEQVIEIVRSAPVDFTAPPDVARDAFEAIFAEAPRPDSIRYEAAEVGGVRGLWARTDAPKADRAIIYLHGGGFVVGSPNAYAALAGSLATAVGIDTFIVDYRLAPEHPYPAAPDDVLQVYSSMLSAGMKSIAVVGDSAGGGLVMSLLLLARRHGLPMPSCGVLWSPWLNLACDTPSYERNAAVDPTLDKAGLLAVARHYAGRFDRGPRRRRCPACRARGCCQRHAATRDLS
jgi:monoterpene epsilon-lactone hydrolase